MCWKRIKQWFLSRIRKAPEAPRRLYRNIKELLELKYIVTSSGLPNAPKRQPCPICGGWRRQIGKTKTSAIYHCGRCQLEYRMTVA